MNRLKTALLLGALSVVLIGIGGAMGPVYLYGFTAVALILNIGAYFFSDRIVLRMHNASEVLREQCPEVHRMVEEIAREAGIPKPRIYLIPEPQPNAFATGRNPSHGVVAVTEGLLRLMTERELRGVLAHEIAHIKNRDILVATIAAGIAAAVSYIAQAGQFAVLFGGGQNDDEDEGWAGSLLFLIVGPIAAMLIQLGISRSREYLADESAAAFTHDPGGLAEALKKLSAGAAALPLDGNPATASLFIVSPLAGSGSLLNLFSTHPPMEKRIARLRALIGNFHGAHIGAPA